MSDARVRSVSTWLPLLRESLNRSGSVRWPLHGHSMTPTLPAGCEIEIAPLPSEVHLGDLVVFCSEEALVAHRLVHRSQGYWITQGDGLWIPDVPIESDQVLGVVTAAYVDGDRCWPGALTRFWSALWVARYHIFRALRAG